MCEFVSHVDFFFASRKKKNQKIKINQKIINIAKTKIVVFLSLRYKKETLILNKKR